jgi:hypothetical protein
VSALQVYRNKVYDLLSDDSNSSTNALRVRTRTVLQTHTEHGRDVCDMHPDQKHVPCKDVEAFRTQLQRIVAARKQGCTGANSKSSRSHLIITLAVRRTVNLGILPESMQQDTVISPEYANMGTEGIRTCRARQYMSTLSLVDLAGSERDHVRDVTANHAVLRTEGIDVALSLSALSACLRERARSSVRHDMKTGAGFYRSSTLTRLLKEPLTSAKIFFLACCSPAACCASATSQTLRYATMVKHIKTNAEDSAMLLEQCLDRFPISFLPHHSLVKHGKIPRSSENLTIYLHELRASVVRIMVSHRWLSSNSDRDLAHPDDKKTHCKYDLLKTLFERLNKSGWIRNDAMLDLVNWIDFCE